MLNFRPHKIQLISSITGGKDDNGMPLPDTENVEEMSCHIEPNGRGNVIYLDGVATNYSYHIFLDQNCSEFKKGDRVRLFGIDGKELENDKTFVVMQFFRYQLNAQLWV